MVENVLVSGGSGGIGSALCRRLSEVGYRPIIGFAKNRANAESIASETDGIPLHLDLARDESVDAAISYLVENAGSLAGVVLAASPPPAIAPVFRVSGEEMSTQWAINVAGPHRLLAGAVRRLMRPRRRGWVYGVLSAAMGVEGAAAKSMGGYIIGKHGMLGLLNVIDAEFSWLEVFTAFPDYTETPMLEAFDPRFLDQMRDRMPEKRFSTPDEVAESMIAKIRSYGG